MSTTQARTTSSNTSAGKAGMTLEAQIIPRVRRRPIQGVRRAPGLQARPRRRPGWRAFASSSSHPGARGPRSRPGQGLTTAAPGPAEGELAVSGTETARDELAGRGIEVSDIWHGPPFPAGARQPGPHPERTSYRPFLYFTDPGGNTRLVQQVTTRPWSAPRPDERR